MANMIYPHGLQGFVAGEIDWDTATIKVAAVSGYTPAVGHKFVSDVTAAGGTVRASSPALTAKTTTSGVVDAADTVISAVPSSAANHGLLVYQASAVTGGADVAATAQRVICWIDTATGVPFTTNGGDVNVTFNASGILSI